MFFVPLGHSRWPSWPLISWTFLYFSTTTEWNLMKFDRKQVLNVHYQVCDFCPRWLPWSLIGWNIFVFSENAKWILTKLHRKQASPNVLYHVCIFILIHYQRWPPWPLIGWNIFWLFSHWMEFDKIWQEGSPQLPLPSLCCLCGSAIQDGCPGLWFAVIFLTCAPQSMEGFWGNLDGK